MTKQSRSLTLNLHNKHGPGLKNFGTITVHAEETVASRNAVEVVFRCMHLDNKDLFSKSVGFIIIFMYLKKNLVGRCSSFVGLYFLGSIFKDLQDCRSRRFCANLQNGDREQQFESCLETPVSEHAAIWEQSKLFQLSVLDVD